MARTNRQYMALDVGTVRVGVALASDEVKIAIPHDTIAMDETHFGRDIAKLVSQHSIDVVVVGYPRNQAGEATQQTAYVEQMAAELSDCGATVVFQDESLTSVIAKERLISKKQGHTKGDVDAEAAAILLQDYMEVHS